MVQEGVGYWFGIATVAQVFAYATSGEGAERSFFSNFLGFLFFSIMAGCTWKILNQQANTISDNSAEEYWVLRFPFSLQAGWSMALAIMSVNILFAAGGGNDDDGGVDKGAVMSAIITFLSVVAYAAMPVKLLFLNGNTPNYVVPVFISVVTVSNTFLFPFIVYSIQQFLTFIKKLSLYSSLALHSMTVRKKAH